MKPKTFNWNFLSKNDVLFFFLILSVSLFGCGEPPQKNSPSPYQKAVRDIPKIEKILKDKKEERGLIVSAIDSLGVWNATQHNLVLTSYTAKMIGELNERLTKVNSEIWDYESALYEHLYQINYENTKNDASNKSVTLKSDSLP